MWRRPVATGGHAVEHVAQIADEAARDGRGAHPTVGAPHFEPADIVLQQQGQQPVVAVLAHSPARHPVSADSGTAGTAPADPPSARRETSRPRAARTRRHPRQHVLARRGDLGQIAQHDVTEVGRLFGHRFGPCSGRSLVGSSVPRYSPSLASGRPEVSSEPTPNHPRHAEPPRRMATTSFSLSGRAKNCPANSISAAHSVGSTPWPTM